MNRKALGKGINALIPNFERGLSEVESERVREGVTHISIEEIEPNVNQPRKLFDGQKMDELVASIREHGIIQPVIVQKAKKGYELIVGERRWRAARLAKLKKIPVVVREVTDKESLQLAIIENIHRQDLNPIEEAEAYSRLIKDFSFTQEEVSKKVGKDRTSVANYLRLLKLSPSIRKDLIVGRLTMGHARALLGLSAEKDIHNLRDKILRNDLNVRQAEALVKNINKKSKQANPIKSDKGDVFVKDLEKQFQKRLGTKVKITPGKKGGKVIITYYNNDDLDRVCDMILPKGSRRL